MCRRCWAASLRLWFLCISQLTVELMSEGVQQVGDGVLHADVSEQLGAQRGHAFLLDTTRHNVSKPGQVRVTVQGQAVRRDVAAAVDSCTNTANVHSDGDATHRTRWVLTRPHLLRQTMSQSSKASTYIWMFRRLC